jgi:tRNA/rRNA methyltransferase
MEKVNLNNISIVLHKPRFPENIGSAARAAANMGIDQLYVISPEDYDRDRMLKLATHAATPIIHAIKVHESLLDALKGFHYVIGTTARTGRNRRQTMHPRRIAQRLAPLSRRNKIAIIFGPEDRGLTNEELKLCQDVVLIPTAGFHSLNVSQAVMIVCWELFSASFEPLIANQAGTMTAALAAVEDVEGMYDHLQETLLRVQFVDRENPRRWMRNIRRFFGRFLLRKADVNMIRGICRQINWALNDKNRKQGL